MSKENTKYGINVEMDTGEIKQFSPFDDEGRAKAYARSLRKGHIWVEDTSIYSYFDG